MTEQGASAISIEISAGLDSLNALSDQKVFSGGANSADVVSVLSQEAKKQHFHSVIYSDPSGSGISDTGRRLSAADEPYFIQAMKGIPNISGSQETSGPAGKIVLAAPILRGDSIKGVLIAFLNGIDQLRLTGGILTGETDYFCVLKKDGAILSGNLSGEDNLFSLLQPDGQEENLNSLRADFKDGTSGISELRIENSSIFAAYSEIQGTDGWIFLTADDYGRIFSRANSILLPSAVLFLLLTAALFLAFFYLFKLKKLNNETNIRNEEQKKYFTFFDPLTNLPNRKGIIREFDDWVEKCRKDSRNGGVLFLDVDNLRSMNNTFGHDAGDKLLCESAARLKKTVGSQDLVGRTGSDEFVVLVHGLNTEDSLEFFAKKIVRIFREPYLVNGMVIQLSCSVGALLLPQRKESQMAQQFEDILGRGEFILNKAKQTRKGSYILFNEDYGNLIDRQLRLERALKFSIENNELACYFQPQFNCLTKTITGFETLARWKSSEFGTISPVQFIPMAEKSGFIKEIGRHVVEEAFSFAKSMEGRKVTVSFNASPMELLEANYADYIISRFQYYGLAPNSVAVEVTESSLIESFEKVTKKLQMLKRHGILVYLDDFGTGFSSLTYLKDLPINAVKIDKSFIDEIVTKDVEKDIVRMIIKLAYRLNLEVIAEGVETEDQIRCVLGAGGHLVQGYFISRPVPREEVPLLFAQMEKQEDDTAGGGKGTPKKGPNIHRISPLPQ
ncbi:MULTISPECIES: putative bifunctional diguanylate cyclase/phosphodiesterase [Acutalibacteraceae]|uniref:putative bifunctional diguanylate cyclase/phosphodiesterase n=1 Tax=Acutalibacteraceae TaxID=3082771 RepID=UPI001FAA918E|nr:MULTISPECIES: EAL domain-containing protein [Acutalibacteraceae]